MAEYYCACGQCTFEERDNGLIVAGTPPCGKNEIFKRVPEPTAMLSSDSAERKNTPICSGFMDYFPLAMAAVARLAKKGNEKHNPGQPLHWSRHKSGDHRDCIARHLIDCGVLDEETGELHDAEVAMRAMMNLEVAEEKRLNKPYSRGSR